MGANKVYPCSSKICNIQEILQARKQQQQTVAKWTYKTELITICVNILTLFSIFVSIFVFIINFWP